MAATIAKEFTNAGIRSQNLVVVRKVCWYQKVRSSNLGVVEKSRLCILCQLTVKRLTTKIKESVLWLLCLLFRQLVEGSSIFP